MQALTELLIDPDADVSGYEQTLELIQRTTGDELVGLIGPERTYELVERLDRQGKTIASVAGDLGRITPSDALRKRNLWILRMRLVDGRSAEEIGERAEITASRVRQLLKQYFGIDKDRPPRGRIAIPLDALPLAREAVRRQLAAFATQLQESLLSDGESLPDRHNFDLSWALLDDLEAAGDIQLARSCGPRLIHAIRAELERERAARSATAFRTTPGGADEKAMQLQGLLNTLLS
ncbi:MAG TPA: sigma factor-like helix-turn-helix DNA-binding protein [Solirubrobacteraceae bacterium]